MATVGLLVLDDELKVVSLCWDDEEEKQRQYDQLMSTAREKSAVAIVLINEGYLGGPEDVEDYYPGKLKEIGAEAVVTVLVAGPTFDCIMWNCRFGKVEGQIVFGDEEFESKGVISNLLEGWAQIPSNNT